MSKLFYPLNLFLNATYSAFNNGITLTANTIGLVTTQTSLSANANGVATTTVNWSFSQTPPQGVSVMAAYSGTTPVMAPLLTWSYSSGVVSISLQFLKLSSGALVAGGSGTYSVTFWLSGG